MCSTVKQFMILNVPFLVIESPASMLELICESRWCYSKKVAICKGP